MFAGVSGSGRVPKSLPRRRSSSRATDLASATSPTSIISSSVSTHSDDGSRLTDDDTDLRTVSIDSVASMGSIESGGGTPSSLPNEVSSFLSPSAAASPSSSGSLTKLRPDQNAADVFKTIPVFLRVLLSLQECACCLKCFLPCLRLKNDNIFDIVKKVGLLFVVSLFTPIMGYSCGGLSLYAGYEIEPYAYFGVCSCFALCAVIYLIFGSFTAFLVAFGVAMCVGTGLMLGLQSAPVAQSMMLPVGFLPFFFNESRGTKILGLLAVLISSVLDLILPGYFAYISYGSSFDPNKTTLQRIMNSVIRWNYLSCSVGCVLLGMLLLSYVDNLQQSYVLKVSEAIVSLDLDCDIVKQLHCLPEVALTPIMKKLKQTIRNVSLYRKFLPGHLLQNTKEVAERKTWSSTESTAPSSTSASTSTSSTSSRSSKSGEQRAGGRKKSVVMNVLDLMSQGLQSVRGSVLVIRLQGWNSFVQTNLLSADLTSLLLNGLLNAVEKRVKHSAGSFDKVSGVTFHFSFGLTSRCMQHSVAACRVAETVSRIKLARLAHSLRLALDTSGLSWSLAVVTGSFFCGNVAAASSVKWFCHSPLFDAATSMVRLNEKLGTSFLVCDETMRMNKYHFVIRRVGSMRLSLDDPVPVHAVLSQKKIQEGHEWNYQIGDALGGDNVDSVLERAWKSCEDGNFGEAAELFKTLDPKKLDVQSDVGAKALKGAIESKEVPTFPV